jgi:hypothetical protein
MQIDLGKKCADCPTPISNTSKDAGEKVYYPSLYLEGATDLKDIPEAGELTVKFKRVSLSQTARDGKTRISVELEVRAITGFKSGDADTSKSGEDALDELKDSLSNDE